MLGCASIEGVGWDGSRLEGLGVVSMEGFEMFLDGRSRSAIDSC